MAEQRTPGPGKTPTAEQKTPGPGGGGGAGDARGELEEFVKRWQGREAKVVYDFTAKSASGDSDHGTVILYWKFPEWRADFQAEGETVSLLQQGDGFFVCPEEERVCYKLPLQAPVPLPLPFFVVRPSELVERIQEWVIEQQTGVDIRRSSRRIAGEEGVCYAVAGSGPGGRDRGEACWSLDGILLLVSVDTSDQQGNRSTFTLEAKAGIERSVSPRAITPPYRVQEFPSIFPTPGR